MNKLTVIALAAGLIAGPSLALANESNHSTTEQTVESCVTTAKAKNDGTTEDVIRRTCTSKYSHTHTRATTSDEGSAMPKSTETTTTVTERTATDSTPPK